MQDLARTKIIIKSPAKINLHLEVIGKREDGFHELAMIMLNIDLSDYLEFKINNEGFIKLESDCKDLSLSDDNLIVKSANLLRKKLNIDENKIAGIILVNPTYHGYAGDLEPLIDCCHQKNLPVLVDEAHGSYFLFCENLNLPKPALSSNADLVVNSLHKSLNGLTQTAVLWYKGNLINEGNLIKSINLLQTTSPSSLLLSSCEESIRDWLNKKSLSKYQKRILEAKSIYKKLIQRNIPLIETEDPLKIVVNTSEAEIDGFAADKFFYKNGLIAELPEMMTLTFCLGFGNQKDFLNLFEKLWKKLLLNSKKSKNLEVLRSPFKLVQAPEIEIGIAWRSKTRSISFSQSLNKISGDIICPYPPGIPLLIPGEKIDIDRFNCINNQSLCNKELVNFNIRVLET